MLTVSIAVRPLSILFYFMGASAGIEVASFNTGYLCEENPDNIVSEYIETECSLKYYNRSINLNINRADSHALNKLGDYYYDENLKKNTGNGIARALNTVESRKAVEFYARTYVRGSSQVSHRSRLETMKLIIRIYWKNKFLLYFTSGTIQLGFDDRRGILFSNSNMGYD